MAAQVMEVGCEQQKTLGYTTDGNSVPGRAGPGVASSSSSGSCFGELDVSKSAVFLRYSMSHYL